MADREHRGVAMSSESAALALKRLQELRALREQLGQQSQSQASAGTQAAFSMIYEGPRPRRGRTKRSPPRSVSAVTRSSW